MLNPMLISNGNLSHVWGAAFLHIVNNFGKEKLMFGVSITEFTNGQPMEDKYISSLLDQALAENQKQNIQTVANTIFPASLWNPVLDRNELYRRYETIWPRVRVCSKKTRMLNGNGTYFQRLIAHGASHKESFSGDVNQLEHVIKTYKSGNRRRSALQAMIFDPRIDHTHQRQRGFPCLQLVAFFPEDSKKSLTVIGDYAIQHIFEKAYGNYLGLCRLGQFMAHEMGLELTQVVCLARVAKLGNGKTGELKKDDVKELKTKLESYLSLN